MPTDIEKDSLFIPLLVMVLMGLIFLGGMLGLAYMGGVFTGRQDVIENDKRIVEHDFQKRPAQ